MQHQPGLAAVRPALPHMQDMTVRRAQVKANGSSGPVWSGHGCCLHDGRLRSAKRLRQLQNIALTNYANPQGGDMNWTKPAYTELRLGFEITMYIANR